ncbi:MAG: zinc-binding alcohol dehydrogenase [Alphaproteobacteria bacterium]|nr:zinc-binding alcohol dehydrogenase [Alphaproteobacteria bacterium]
MSDTKALWYVGGGRAELRDQPTPRAAAGEVVIRATWSALSRGTERLVIGGRVPASEHDRMRCPHQEGAFPFPVKYGYALAGEVVGGDPSRLGQRVFALHPHQSVCAVASASAHPIPDGVPSRRATLAANAETALNVIWDARVGPGDRMLIVGGGVLGLLIARIAAQIPGTLVTVCDTDAGRAAIAERMGARFALPATAPTDQDIVVHTSATTAGLETALAHAGVEARVVEASWHGDAKIGVSLGGAFHARRLQLISSQVGSVPADRRIRWTNARRIAAALELLADNVFDHLITGEIAFADAAIKVPAVLADRAPGLATVLKY